jgi:mycofactocin precursor
MENDTREEAIDESIAGTTTGADESALIADELLVEEISIDGMCGVY